MIRLPLIVAALCLSGCGEVAVVNKAPPATANAAAPAPPPAPLGESVRVRLETELGPIVLTLDHARAPITTANFVAYVDQRRLDGTSFYRAARTEGYERRGFIQGGIRRDFRRMLAPIAHEPTSATGIRHGPGAISMARREDGPGAMGDFFITTDAMPQMDAGRGREGFAAFGRVTEGMDVVRRILAAPTVANAGRGAMRGQMIAAPVRIVSARRVEE